MFVDSMDRVVSELFIKHNDIQALFINELRIKLEYEKDFLAFLSAIQIVSVLCIHCPPQWEAADAEIKVPFGENTELKRYPFKAWSRSVQLYPYMLRLLPGISSSLISTLLVHLPAFFAKPLPISSVLPLQNLSRFLQWCLWLTLGSCVDPQNKIGHPAGRRFPVLSAREI